MTLRFLYLIYIVAGHKVLLANVERLGVDTETFIGGVIAPGRKAAARAGLYR